MVKVAVLDVFKGKNLVDWSVFGKFMINLKLLKKNGILLFKYKSYAPIPWLKRQNLSISFKQFWISLMDTTTVDYDLLRNCSDSDIILFEKILLKSGLIDDLDYQQVQSNSSQLVERFNILRGELQASNNNPEIITELKIVIDKLVNLNKITLEDKTDIIEGLEEYINGNNNI